MKSSSMSTAHLVKWIVTCIALMFSYLPTFAYTSETWARISNTNTGNQNVYFLVDTEKKEATVIDPSIIGYPSVQYSGKIDLQETVYAYVNGYGNLQFNITAIGDNAFMGTSLTEIIIPQTVKKIGASAFKNCGNLRNVIICGRNCDYIGTSCFQGTSSNIFWFNPLDRDTSGILYVPYIGNNAFSSSNHVYVFNSNEYKNHFPYNFSPIIILEKTFQYNGAPDVDIITELPSDIAIAIDKTTLPKDCGTHTGTIQVDIHYRDALHWSDYKDSFTETYNITITKAPLQFDTGTYERFYGESNPVISYSAVHGFVNGETINDLINPPTFYSVANEVSDVGVYPIQVRGEALNYTYSCIGSLNIKPAPLEVTVLPTNSIYGEEPNFKFALNGLQNGETSPVLISDFIFSGPTKLSDVGEYVVQIKGGKLKNYEVISYINGIHTIKKASLTLTARNATRLYYEENPKFDFSLEGLRNNDGKSVITLLPTYTCDAVMSSDVGIYSIIPSSAQAKNYDISYRSGQLSITKRALSASAISCSRHYGEKNPEFEISYTGFVNGEDHSVLTDPVIANCTADETSDVGTYPITLQGGVAINYEVKSYTSGNLIIEKADQTITWNQDLSNVTVGSQIALNATSSSGLPVSYEMSPNNVATLYSNRGTWYLDCYASGAVNIRANHAGDKNHNPSDVVTKTLVVFGRDGNDPSNPQIYLHIENPGSLPSLIAENRKYQIKNLRLSGYLNGTDINYIREMAGSDAYGNTTLGVLESLDISSCSIVSGGRSYFSKGVSCYTSNNSISDYMFYNCGVLVNLLLPTNATILEDYALANCVRLSTLSLPNVITSIGRETFKNDIGLLRIHMPEQLASIADKAFMGCNNLTEIDIPANVRFIGDGIVKDCENISRINVDASNQYFVSIDGVLFDYDCSTLKIFPVNNSASVYKVPDGVTRIAPYAFVNSKRLTKVTLPSSLLTIGTDAFIGCTNLNVLHTEAIVPPVCDNDCFESVSKTRCELQVPQGCYNAYWVAPIWSEFNKIAENGSSSIDDGSMDNIEVSINGLNIMVTGTPNDTYVRIYQMNGLLIYQQCSNGEDISYQPATTGIYIVVVGNKTYKTMVR